jgi:HK97 family phage portal protein
VGLLGSVRQFFSGVFGRRQPDPAWYQRYVIPMVESGVLVTPDEALSVSTCWACIDAIGKAIASCEWNIYAPGPDRKLHLQPEDPLAWVLNTRPNPEMTAIAFREAMLYIAIPFGNAYAEVVKDGAGRVAQLWPLEDWRVQPRRDPEGQLYYQYAQPDGTLASLRPDQVFHLKGPSINGLLGENVVARAVKSISVAAAAERYAGAFFGRGAHPGGVLEHPGKLGAVAAERIQKDFDERRAGPANAHRTLVLEEGMKWTAISIEPEKSQLLETRQFSVEEICRWFGVPPHKVQHLLRATFSNIEHLSIEFVRDALTPWCRRLEQEGDFKLFQQKRGPWRKTLIDTMPLTYGDAAGRAGAHAIWRQNGIFNTNEIRAKEGANDIGPEGDVYLVQSNLTTVGKIVAAPAPAPTLTPGSAGKDVTPEPEEVSTPGARVAP